MNAILTSLAALLLGVLLSLLSWGGAHAQVRISSLPAAATLTGGELIPAVQNGANVVTTPAAIRAYAGGGGGGAPGGSPGQIQYNNAGAFGGFTLGGDCTLSVPTITCGKTGGSAFGAFATGTNAANLTGTAPAGVLSGSYAGITGVGTLSAGSIPSSLVTGLGTFAAQNYAAPPAIGGTTPAAGAFTTLSASGTIITGGLTGFLYGNGGSAVTAATAIPNAAITGLGTAAAVNTGTSGATIPLLNASNTFSGIDTFSSQVKLTGALSGSAGRTLISATAPTVSSGFGTGPTVNSNNSAVFAVTEGATGSPSTTGVITLPAATTGWVCFANDQTSATITARQSAASTTGATITFSAAPANNDVIVFLCGAY